MEIREIKPTIVVAPAFKRVAAYARVSVEKQAALDSLSNQVSYYNDYIGNHPGWLFAGVYADYGLSGTKENRPEFQRMLTDARAGKFDVVITKSITRFARNTVTLLKTVRELKELGIEVLFEKENMSSFSADGDLMLSLIAMFAEEEARSASENKRWQIQKQFEEGKPTYFRMLGYKWIDGQLSIIPEEAEIVRRIFSDYLSGIGRMQIAHKLNAEGITCGKRVWRAASIETILKNEKYTGNMLLQKHYVDDFRTKKTKRNKGERRQYYVEESHEPIIPMKQFKLVQAEIARREKLYESRHKGVTHLFSRMIVCGMCGAGFTRKNAPTSSEKKHIPVWMCTTFDTLGKEFCPAQRIQEEILIEKTREVLQLPETSMLNREILLESITRIEVPAHNNLRYYLKNGHIETIEWENASRSKSWTAEMRRKAREKTYARHHKNDGREDK